MKTRWVTLGQIGEDYAEKTRDFLRRMGPYSTREFEGNSGFGLKMSVFKDKTMLRRSKWAHGKSRPPKFKYTENLPGPAVSDIDRFVIPQKSVDNLPSMLDSFVGVQRFERF